MARTLAITNREWLPLFDSLSFHMASAHLCFRSVRWTFSTPQQLDSLRMSSSHASRYWCEVNVLTTEPAHTRLRWRLGLRRTRLVLWHPPPTHPRRSPRHRGRGGECGAPHLRAIPFRVSRVASCPRRAEECSNSTARQAERSDRARSDTTPVPRASFRLLLLLLCPARQCPTARSATPINEGHSHFPHGAQAPNPASPHSAVASILMPHRRYPQR